MNKWNKWNTNYCEIKSKINKLWVDNRQTHNDFSIALCLAVPLRWCCVFVSSPHDARGGPIRVDHPEVGGSLTFHLIAPVFLCVLISSFLLDKNEKLNVATLLPLRLDLHHMCLSSSRAASVLHPVQSVFSHWMLSEYSTRPTWTGRRLKLRNFIVIVRNNEKTSEVPR